MNHPRQFYRAPRHASASASTARPPAMGAGHVLVALAAIAARRGGRRCRAGTDTRPQCAAGAADQRRALAVRGRSRLEPAGRPRPEPDGQSARGAAAAGRAVLVPGAGCGVLRRRGLGVAGVLEDRLVAEHRPGPGRPQPDPGRRDVLVAISAGDKAGTHGITSSVATFAKMWNGTVTGGVLSDTPAGRRPASCA